MGNPEQTDLIEFLAGRAGQAAAQLRAVLGSAGATACVQHEHTGRASRIEGGQANAAAAPMSPHRLLVCLAVIGWPERELARRTGRLQTTVRRWTGGRSPVPADVAAWVETLAALHRAHPAPRAGQGLPEQPAPRPL